MTPVNKIEKYLASMAGEKVELPEPVTTIEKYLYAIAAKGDTKADSKPKGPNKEPVGIKSVEQTKMSEEPGGENELTITLTNGQTSKFVVRNGTRGPRGPKGK